MQPAELVSGASVLLESQRKRNRRKQGFLVVQAEPLSAMPETERALAQKLRPSSPTIFANPGKGHLTTRARCRNTSACCDGDCDGV